MKINTAALALLAASAAALPLSTINATLSAVNATGSPFTNATATAAGPGESIEACVMPDGCRWKDDRPGPFDPPRTTWSQASTTTTEPTSRSAPSFGDWITSILMPGSDTSSVPTETSTTDTPGFPPMPTVSVVMPTTDTTFMATVPNIPLQTPPTATEIRPVLPTTRLPTPKTYTIIHPVLPTGEPVA